MPAAFGQSPHHPLPPPGETTPPLPRAWQPLTPRGVAAFSRTPWRRLLLVQLLVAILVSATMAWFLHVTCLPTLRKSIGKLPDQGRIQHQSLFTPLTNTTALALDPVLGIVVDLPGHAPPELPSDVRVFIRQSDVEIRSPFGCLVFRYPQGWIIEFNRKELAPALEAWTPAALTLAGLATASLLWILWTSLASLFFPVPILVARYSDRALTLRGSWKLASAALLPGTLFLAAALIVYGLGWLDLIQFALLAAAHLMIGWLYFVLSPLALPRTHEPDPDQNPFLPPPPPDAPDPITGPNKQKNPFHPGAPSPPARSNEFWEP